MNRGYDLDYGLLDPKVIVDAGANIGLTSVFYALRFPAARIVALEPDSENFDVLSSNVRDFSNIFPVKAALWHERATVEIRDPGEGAWGFRVGVPSGEGDAADSSTYRGVSSTMTVQELIDANGGRLDLLKLDIEGSEWNVLLHASDWIEHVGALVAELHPTIHPDCRKVFDAATTDFRGHGESNGLVLARR